MRVDYLRTSFFLGTTAHNRPRVPEIANRAHRQQKRRLAYEGGAGQISKSEQLVSNFRTRFDAQQKRSNSSNPQSLKCSNQKEDNR